MMTVLCPKEVASLLGVSERTARRLMRAGVIESFQPGRKLLRTTRSRVYAYIDGQCERYRRPVSITRLRAA